ncbi:family 16 glycosylhydrolase [Rubrobacter tropicus]|uniref:Beta-glucanase n=1 Tax=Rubrobacter tropicus TaxID=2653851 RepID=A0A6G8Q6V3_9ACTN|nr:glycoside hydrolase family 16 protein [Rubrobacter tropicus]QIN82182.1 family 16 glycosylhydrolase [Rubrobacter tropicus]
MKRVWVLFAVGALQVFLISGVAQAQGAGFFDGFGTFEAARWTKENHALGRGYLDADNVSVANGHLRLKMPANTVQGAEIRSNNLYYHGSYAARLKLPNTPGSVTGFFVYRPPDFAREIDIEIPNDSSRRIWFTTHAGGRTTNHVTMRLPFDPTASFHDYAFTYGPGAVRFYVDGKLMKTFNTGLPQNTMYLYTNTWFPTWLDGKKPRRDSYVLVDWIRHTR